MAIVKEEQITLPWMICDLSSGRFNGLFADRSVAEGVLEELRQWYPKGTLVLVKVVESPDGPLIPASRFLA